MGGTVYQELAAGAELADRVECLWYRIEEAGDQLIVPDGCLDLIWLDDQQLVLVGADSGARSITMAPGVRTCGIRFRPGAAGSIMRRSAGEVVDQQVPANWVWPGSAARLAANLAAASPDEQLTQLKSFVATRPGTVDQLVAAAAHMFDTCGDRVSRVADKLGVSERQLHRRTTAAVGYGPKMLARVMRARRLAWVSGTSLAGLAHAAGYASQAHMGDDIRALTGMTPVRFLEYLGRSDTLT